MKVAVLMGGISGEREISLRSGAAVALALQKKGHEVISVDIKGVADLLGLKKLAPKAVYIALHGRFGEDGAVQGLLEWLEIPYTGPSVLSSAICFDKIISKKLVSSLGIATPDSSIYEKGQDWDRWLASFSLKTPVIVKPNAEGSSIGLTKVGRLEGLKKAIELALKSDRKILVEEFIFGRELTVGVLNGRALPVVEIIPKSGLYDYSAKYTLGATSYLVPALIGEKMTSQAMKISENIYSLLRCSSAARVDYILGKDDSLHFLELNTSPGMTETSLLPKAALAAGISIEDLCDQILESASLKKG